MILADGMVDMECPFSIYLPLGAPTKVEMRLERYRTRNHVTNLGMTGLQAREIQTLSKSLNNETQSKTSLVQLHLVTQILCLCGSGFKRSYSMPWLASCERTIILSWWFTSRREIISQRSSRRDASDFFFLFASY